MDYSSKLMKLSQEIFVSLDQEDEWQEFQTFFGEIHPDFTEKLFSLSGNTLSTSEMRLGMLLRLNLSSKEIASITQVTPDSVRVARYRLRRKLPIETKEELASYLLSI
ncbi:hypothetical protein U1E44_10780 [Arenibacter sp. GZD96]|uniref:helix-turn-helix transcriptional regulator n=1 Tax=Aurantibrevibacter litoralis TaxID=3106030 RepID=UPI002AFF4947|nr:hypothetical protein [Arenibacter sp. GZD-96]MEA1786577.1 hypothetical protein [Arenibacter sp. GZD-96]